MAILGKCDTTEHHPSGHLVHVSYIRRTHERYYLLFIIIINYYYSTIITTKDKKY